MPSQVVTLAPHIVVDQRKHPSTNNTKQILSRLFSGACLERNRRSMSEAASDPIHLIPLAPVLAGFLSKKIDDTVGKDNDSQKAVISQRIK